MIEQLTPALVFAASPLRVQSAHARRHPRPRRMSLPRSMLAWYRRLPLTVRLPAVVALMIFAAAMGTTQLALQSVSRQFEAQMAGIGQVYLDGALIGSYPTREVARRLGIMKEMPTVIQGGLN